MKRLTVFVLLLCLLHTTAVGETAEPVLSYQSETLRFTVESLCYEGAECYLTRIWMADPGQQIRKATATWEQDLRYPSEMAEDIPGAALCINGSGYVSPVFPSIPDDYRGQPRLLLYTAGLSDHHRRAGVPQPGRGGLLRPDPGSGRPAPV